MLLALEDYLDPPQIVILRGSAQALQPWQRELNAVFATRRWLLAVPADATGLPPALASKPPGDAPIAYVCRGSQCTAPLRSLAALLGELDRHVAGPAAGA
jgi:uncharacterized protein YyaL (SSP411 family)